MKHIGRKLLAVVAIVGWSLAVGAGLERLWSYQSEPGAVQQTAARWPERSALSLSASLPTVVMFVHPRCTCSRASLTELRELMARNPGRLQVSVLFLKVQGWTRDGLWDFAQTLPGIHLAADDEGAEARRFGVATSGHLLVYAPDGRLQFSGGITGSRGHVGDNAHLQQVMNVVTAGEFRSAPLTPVYGCSLR